jgi:hypothetical protein
VDEGTFLSDWSPYPTAPSTARSCSPFCCRPRGGTIRSFSFAFLFLFFRAADGQARTQNKHRRAIARHEEKDVYRSTYRCIAIIPLRKKLTDLQSLQTPPFQSQTIARFNSNFQLLKLKKSKNQKITGDDKTETTAAGCFPICVSPAPDKGKRKISFVTLCGKKDQMDCGGDLTLNPDLLVSPRGGDKTGASKNDDCKNTVTSKKTSKKRRVSEVPQCGNLGVLPVEILEVVLLKCPPKSLGALTCVSKYFKNTGIVERVAKLRVDKHPRADGVQPRQRETPNAARVLHFADAADVALRTAAGLDLGAFHTAVLGIGGGPGNRPGTELSLLGAPHRARGFHETHEDNDSEKSHSCEDTVSGKPAGSSDSAQQASTLQYQWGIVPGVAVSKPLSASSARETAAAAQPKGRTLYTFGRGFHGQLGQGGYDDATAPSQVSLAGTSPRFPNPGLHVLPIVRP